MVLAIHAMVLAIPAMVLPFPAMVLEKSAMVLAIHATVLAIPSGTGESKGRFLTPSICPHGPPADTLPPTPGCYVAPAVEAIGVMVPQRLGIPYLLALIVAVACASCASKPPVATGKLDWHPQLDQPIRQLEEVLAATEQQQPRNYTSSNLAFVLDAKLYLLFDRYVASAPVAERPAIVDEQRQWLRKRKRATHEAYAEYEGGTLASFAGNRAFIDATKARISEIDSRLGAAVAAVP